jgi:hypothetical protein
MQCDTTCPERALFRFVCEFDSSSQEQSQGELACPDSVTTKETNKNEYALIFLYEKGA